MSTGRGLPVVIALVVWLVVVVGGIAACGDGADGSAGDGPAGFLSREGATAIFVQWTRVGDDVSGTVSEATLPGGKLRQATAPFTGTVRDDSVRLQIGAGAGTGRVNGRLDGDTLELTIPQNAGVLTRRLTPASKDDYTRAVRDIRNRE